MTPPEPIDAWTAAWVAAIFRGDGPSWSARLSATSPGPVAGALPRIKGVEPTG